MTRLLWRLTEGFRLRLASVTALALLGSLLESIGIASVLPLLEQLSGENDPSRVTRMLGVTLNSLGVELTTASATAVALAFFGAKAIVQYAAQSSAAATGQDIRVHRIDRSLGGILRAPWDQVVTEDQGALLNAVLYETSREQQFLDLAVRHFANAMNVMVFATAAFWVSPHVTALAVAFVVVLSGAIILTLRGVNRSGQEIVAAGNDLTGRIRETISGLKTLRAFNATERLHELVGIAARDRGRAHVRVARVEAGLGALAELLVAVVLLSLLGLATSVASGSLAEVGVVAGLLIRIAQKAKAFQSVSQLASMAPAVNAVQQLLEDHPMRAPSEGAQVPTATDIRLDDVSYHYRGEARPAVENMSIEIARGEFLGVVGPSGSGKSTFVALLLGLLEPTSGKILIGDTPLVDIDPRNLRGRVGYVPQRPFLIRGSIADNIRFFRNVNDDDMRAAIQVAALEEVVARLPSGIDTQVGDEGETLSGGEQQRVCLARAIAGNPEILVLDEATSALDTASEQQIQEAITRLHGQVTLVAVAHRLSTVFPADNIAVLDHGRLIELGTPEALLSDPHSTFHTMVHLAAQDNRH